MSTLRDALERLRDALERVPLHLDLPSGAAGRTARDELVDQVGDYLLPRLARIDAPLLAVVGGSTGAGKSTIVNSLVGSVVSTAGVRRPTTRTPVLACHPDDLGAFEGGGVLPDLPRLTGTTAADGGPLQALRLVEVPTLPPGLALLDSPDIDSVEVAHHDLAAQLLGAADLWLFVTTAARYSDAVPWAHLERARERGVVLAVVVNRIPAGATAEILDHLRGMLGDHGLGDTPLFAVDEVPLEDGQIGGGLDPLRGWLERLAVDASARRDTVRRTLDGALDSIPDRLTRVLAADADHRRAVQAMQATAIRRFDQARDEIESELTSGSVLRDQVLERFREAIPTASWMDSLQRGVGRLRDRMWAAVTGQDPPVEAARGAIGANLVDVVRRAVDEAALDTVEVWRTQAGGDAVLAAAPAGIDRSSPGLADDLARQVERWQDGVVQLVRDRAGAKMNVARGLSIGVNTIGVSLMVLVFASTGGVTGGEAAVAGGTAAVSQALLSAVFGEQAVRDLTRDARDDLLARIAGLVEAEQSRLLALVAAHADPGASAAVEDAMDALREARR